MVFIKNKTQFFIIIYKVKNIFNIFNWIIYVCPFATNKYSLVCIDNTMIWNFVTHKLRMTEHAVWQSRMYRKNLNSLNEESFYKVNEIKPFSFTNAKTGGDFILFHQPNIFSSAGLVMCSW